MYMLILQLLNYTHNGWSYRQILLAPAMTLALATTEDSCTLPVASQLDECESHTHKFHIFGHIVMQTTDRFLLTLI